MSRYYNNIEIFKDHYNIDGKDYTRVSEVLDIINKPYLNIWRVNKGKKESDRIMKEAQDIGKQVHKVLEYVIKGKAVPKELLNDITKRAIEEFILWCRANGFKPTAGELTVYSDECGYAGTMDCKGTMGNGIAILDFKTGKLRKEAYLQICAYADAYCEMTREFPTQLYIMRFAKTKKGKFEVIKLTERERIECFGLFENALNLWHYFNDNIKHNDTEDRVDKWRSREGIHYAKKKVE